MLLSALREIVGRRHVLAGGAATRRFRKGFREGGGGALAVVRPGTLVEQWRVLQTCVAADAIVIMQAANTGLTGGSVPSASGYDRQVVIVSTLRLKQIHLLGGGRQVLCLPGATLDRLERLLAPLAREPHSVIGSSCIGATVTGGVCNNSGGALVRRGPAYTELALYARRCADGGLELVNNLGIDAGLQGEELLRAIEEGRFPSAAVAFDNRRASDSEYATEVRRIDADTPARFNADPRLLNEASGSAGRVALFAVRLDTFPADGARRMFYVGANDPAALTALRRHILSRFEHLPVSAEYIHRGAFDLAERYGRDTLLAALWLGTTRLGRMLALKGWADGWVERLGLPASLTDHVAQLVARAIPGKLPARMRQFRQRHEHHLLLDAADAGIDELRAHLATAPNLDHFECTPGERKRALLHRFAVAGAAVRYRSLYPDKVADVVALDVALRRDDRDWADAIPAEVTADVELIHYGHFLCHVFHRDYLVRRGADPAAVKTRLMRELDARRAQCPAEHNVGHAYAAPEPLRAHYRRLDPCNSFNPGIGKTPRGRNWEEA